MSLLEEFSLNIHELFLDCDEHSEYECSTCCGSDYDDEDEYDFNLFKKHEHSPNERCNICYYYCKDCGAPYQMHRDDAYKSWCDHVIERMLGKQHVSLIRGSI